MNNILKEDIQLFASRFALATELEGKTIAVTGEDFMDLDFDRRRQLINSLNL